jgi:Tol biopolymer transport system component
VAAHAHGIVHRDIKPENVMLRPDGLVKVLDFGLAKLTADSAALETTHTAFHTDAGTVAGTVAYMSPEQARGQHVDARTDIWSLGVVLYEMVAGRSPFAASSSSDMLAAILEHEPAPLARSEPEVPAELQRVVTKALRKDRAQRYQTVQDLLLDVQVLREEVRRSCSSPAALTEQPAPGTTVSSGSVSPPTPTRRRPWVVAALVVLASVAAATAWWTMRASPSPTTSSSRVERTLTRLTFGQGLQTDVTFSPDGRFIAYASDRAGKFDIWVQQVAGGDPVQITKSPEHDTQPAWSPDGSTIAFRSERDGGGIFAVPALGGLERQLTSMGTHPSWSPDGREILFFDGIWPGEGIGPLRVHVLSLQENLAREIRPDFFAGGMWSWAAWHPDGRVSALGRHGEHGSGLFTVARDGGRAIASKPLPDVPIARVGWNEPERFTWDASGRSIYVQASPGGVHNLWRISVDPATTAWVAVERLTTGAGPDLTPALSRDGSRLAFSTVSESSRAWVFPLSRGTQPLAAGKPVTEDGARAEFVRLSPDGRYLAYNLLRSGTERFELWIADLVEGTHRHLRMDARVGCWSPSQRSIVSMPFQRERGSFRAAVAILFLTGQERLISRWTVHSLPTLPAAAILSPYFIPEDCISEDVILGAWVTDTPRAVTLALWPTSGPEADRPQRILLEREGMEIWQARLSPNRRWMSFVILRPERPGHVELVVAPAATPDRWRRVAADHAWPDKPRWAADGRTLYFISRRPTSYFNLWAVRFDPETGTPVGEPAALTSFEAPSLHISPRSQTAETDISAEHAVLTMRSVTGSIWMLDNVDK